MEEQPLQEDMDRVHDEALRLADEFNNRLTSMGVLVSGTMAAWFVVCALLILCGTHAALSFFFGVTCGVPICAVYIWRKEGLQWRALSGANIQEHCTLTAVCAVLTLARPLNLALLAKKEDALWQSVLDVTNRSRVSHEARLRWTLDKLAAASVASYALRYHC